MAIVSYELDGVIAAAGPVRRWSLRERSGSRRPHDGNVRAEASLEFEVPLGPLLRTS